MGTIWPPTLRNLSSAVLVGSGKKRSVGPEVEAVGGVGGAQRRNPGGGLRTAAKYCVVLGPLLSDGVVVERIWTVHGGRETNLLRTGLSWLGPWRPARASTSRTPRSICGTSSSWTGPPEVSRDGMGGLLAKRPTSGVDLNRPRVLHDLLDRLWILPFDCGGRILESWISLGISREWRRPLGVILTSPHSVQDHSALSLSILAKDKGPLNLPNLSGFLDSKLQCFEDWPCAPTRHGSEAWCSVCLASSGPRVKRYAGEPLFLFITCLPLLPQIVDSRPNVTLKVIF